MSEVDDTRGRLRWPGPQRRRRHAAAGTFGLYAILIFMVLLTIQAIVRQNSNAPTGSRILDVDLISPSAGLSLIATLLTLLVIRYNVALGIRPIFAYTSDVVPPRKTLRATLGRNLQPLGLPSRAWLVTLRNSGGGVALIRRTDFYVRVRESSGAVIEGPFDHTEVVALLAKEGLIHGKHVWLANMGNGFAISSDQETEIAELSVEFMTKVDLLDIELVFDGLLESRYVKNIFCVPRFGLETQLPELRRMLNEQQRG